jgi:hypothetical protein
MGALYGDGLGDLPAGSAGMSLRVHAGVLAKKPQLQHVVLYGCQLSGDSTGVAQLLSDVQGLKQLKHLNLISSLQSCPTDESTPPAVAYSVLTSSSMLQYLDISGCLLPAGVWQYLFPGGKQLPHLESLGL